MGSNLKRVTVYWGAKNGHEGVVKVLLFAKADVEMTDSVGRTPLFCAAQKGHEES